MTEISVHRYAGREALAQTLARSLAADIESAVTKRGHASLVVSGGSTPRPLFAALLRLELPWEKTWITLADERWVDPGDAASNEALLRRELLDEISRGASRARFKALKNEAPTPEAGRDAAEAALAEIPRPFDAVVLGMGEDGHTASLFPGAPELEDGLDMQNPRLCLAVRPPEATHPRLSLTLKTLLDSRRIVLHLAGESKWRVFQAAREAGPVAELPIRAVLRSGRPVEVFWAP